jgi:hypothetical protein
MEGGSPIKLEPRPYSAQNQIYLPDIVINENIDYLFTNNLTEKFKAKGVHYWPGEDIPQSWLGVPLSTGSGCFGALVLESHKRFSENDAIVMKLISRQTAITIENVRLYEKLDRYMSLYPDPDTVNKQKLRVFLCHSSDDIIPVQELFDSLQVSNVDLWLDKVKLLPGQDWEFEIAQAIKSAHVVIVCLSGSSVNRRGYIHKEIKMALDIAEEQPEGSIYIIPVKFEECEIPGQVKKWQWVNLYEPGGLVKLKLALSARGKELGNYSIYSQEKFNKSA